ncbi:MAG: hypothetical protein FVQ81_15710 [Candidatus Glassbacteria bacterium]|nr:hypothetical protein [Candidatus Glassbacteria bacterium]
MVPMVLNYQQLKSLSREKLIEEYDQKASSTVIGLNFLREEIARRDFEEQNRLIIAMTQEIRNLTIFVAVLTLINVILVAFTIWRG